MRLQVLRRVLQGQKPTQRLATSLLIAGCLALQLSGSLHLAMVEHELCLEHGEVVDVEAGHGHAHAVPARAQRTDDQVEAGGGHGPVPASSHDHCPLTQDRSGRVLLVCAALAGPHEEAPRAVEHPRAYRWSMAPSALRLLAPKTSPPV